MSETVKNWIVVAVAMVMCFVMATMLSGVYPASGFAAVVTIVAVIAGIAVPTIAADSYMTYLINAQDILRIARMLARRVDALECTLLHVSTNRPVPDVCNEAILETVAAFREAQAAGIVKTTLFDETVAKLGGSND